MLINTAAELDLSPVQTSRSKYCFFKLVNFFTIQIIYPGSLNITGGLFTDADVSAK